MQSDDDTLRFSFLSDNSRFSTTTLNINPDRNSAATIEFDFDQDIQSSKAYCRLLPSQVRSSKVEDSIPLVRVVEETEGGAIQPDAISPKNVDASAGPANTQVATVEVPIHHQRKEEVLEDSSMVITLAERDNSTAMKTVERESRQSLVLHKTAPDIASPSSTDSIITIGNSQLPAQSVRHKTISAKDDNPTDSSTSLDTSMDLTQSIEAESGTDVEVVAVKSSRGRRYYTVMAFGGGSSGTSDLCNAVCGLITTLT